MAVHQDSAAALTAHHREVIAAVEAGRTDWSQYTTSRDELAAGGMLEPTGGSPSYWSKDYRLTAAGQAAYDRTMRSQPPERA